MAVGSVGLLPAAFGLGDSGGGPLSGETTMAAIIVGVCAAAVPVSLIGLMRPFGHGGGNRSRVVPPLGQDLGGPGRTHRRYLS